MIQTRRGFEASETLAYLLPIHHAPFLYLTIDSFIFSTKNRRKAEFTLPRSENPIAGDRLSGTGSRVPERSVLAETLTGGDTLEAAGLQLGDEKRNEKVGGGGVDVVFQDQGAAGVETGLEGVERELGVGDVGLLPVVGVDVDVEDLVAELLEGGERGGGGGEVRGAEVVGPAADDGDEGILEGLEGGTELCIALDAQIHVFPAGWIC